MAYMLNNLENNKIYLFLKNKLNFNKNKSVEFDENSRIPGLIEDVVSKRAELNNLILYIKYSPRIITDTQEAC